MQQTGSTLGPVRRQMHWLVPILAAVLWTISWQHISLQQEVGESYFFAEDDPAFVEAERIKAIFPSRPVLVINAATSRIRSPEYIQRVAALTDALAANPQILNVRSITSGPQDIDDAIDSPLWRRVLIPDQFDSTNIFAVVEPNDKRDNTRLMAEVDALVARLEQPDFKLRVAGAPYIVEQVRKFLTRDFHVFSGAAALIFGAIILLLFRSPKLLFGSLTCCGIAVMATLLMQSALSIPLGLLTTNTVTVVFVLTASHIVFMTFNWRHIARDETLPDYAAAARNRTFMASFWCMLTTLLGFATLLLVDAKPLRALGICGAIGTAASLISAYALYPMYLRWTDPRPRPRAPDSAVNRFWRRPLLLPATLFALACVALGVGLPQVQTDPSLLDYFRQGSEIRNRLTFADQHGGSAPLQFVVRRDVGGELNDSEAYERLWFAHRALEEDPAVGTVVSLPLLMAEADRHPLSMFMTWEWLLQILESDRYGGAARGFVTEDRRLTRFTLAMIESERDESRSVIIDRLEDILARHGFETVYIGEAYFLQAELADRVGESLITGLAGLMAALAIIALIVGRSPRVILGLLFCLTLVPLVIIGGDGLLGVPLDIISSPSANVCIGLAIDMMIHLVVAMRVARRQTDNPWQAWVLARQDQWHAVAGAALVVTAGFSIFALSQFPPTQRFGISVAVGTAVAAVASLLVLPLIAAWRPRDVRALEAPERSGAGDGHLVDEQRG
jgi:predicted RND superfamily exporter protein